MNEIVTESALHMISSTSLVPRAARHFIEEAGGLDVISSLAIHSIQSSLIPSQGSSPKSIDRAAKTALRAVYILRQLSSLRSVLRVIGVADDLVLAAIRILHTCCVSASDVSGLCGSLFGRNNYTMNGAKYSSSTKENISSSSSSSSRMTPTTNTKENERQCVLLQGIVSLVRDVASAIVTRKVRVACLGKDIQSCIIAATSAVGQDDLNLKGRCGEFEEEIGGRFWVTVVRQIVVLGCDGVRNEVALVEALVKAVLRAATC